MKYIATLLAVMLAITASAGTARQRAVDTTAEILYTYLQSGKIIHKYAIDTTYIEYKVCDTCLISEVPRIRTMPTERGGITKPTIVIDTIGWWDYQFECDTYWVPVVTFDTVRGE